MTVTAVEYWVEHDPDHGHVPTTRAVKHHGAHHTHMDPGEDCPARAKATAKRRATRLAKEHGVTATYRKEPSDA